MPAWLIAILIIGVTLFVVCLARWLYCQCSEPLDDETETRCQCDACRWSGCLKEPVGRLAAIEETERIVAFTINAPFEDSYKFDREGFYR